MGRLRGRKYYLIEKRKSRNSACASVFDYSLGTDCPQKLNKNIGGIFSLRKTINIVVFFL